MNQVAFLGAALFVVVVIFIVVINRIEVRLSRLEKRLDEERRKGERG